MLQGILTVLHTEWCENALSRWCCRTRVWGPFGFAQGRLFDSVNSFASRSSYSAQDDRGYEGTRGPNWE
jgi:hypothetical protein